MDGTLLQQLMGHHGKIMCVAWSPNGSQLASCGGSDSGGELFAWDPQRGESVNVFGEHPRIIHAIAWASDRLLICGGEDGKLKWWNVESDELLWVIDAHHGTVLSLKRSPDGTKLASCGDDGEIRIWDLATGEHLQTLRRDRPYERLNISGIKGVTEAQKATLRALGAIEEMINGPNKG